MTPLRGEEAEVDARTEAREFLQSRRARLTPQGSGLLSAGSRRRVPGLRREEVAQLAGMSVDYYTRLEKGRLETASTSVLESISRALRLDAAERSHLFALARALRGGAPETPCGAHPAVRPSVQWLLDTMTHCPAYVRNNRLDVLAVNAMGRVLYCPAFVPGEPLPNLAEFCFLDARARDFFPEWDVVAAETAAVLRSELGQDPADAALNELVDRLRRESEDFPRLWATHHVRQTPTEVKLIRHPLAGDMLLTLEAHGVAADPGQTLITYVAEPGSQSQRRLFDLAERGQLPV